MRLSFLGSGSSARPVGPAVGVLALSALLALSSTLTLPLGLSPARAQDEAPDAKDASTTVVVLGLGVLGGEVRGVEIPDVPEGPPAGTPHEVVVPRGDTEVTLGVDVGLLDREQQVIEVHLFRGDEPLVQLLIEPDVVGHADLDEETSLVVHLEEIRERRAEETEGGAGEED